MGLVHLLKTDSELAFLIGVMLGRVVTRHGIEGTNLSALADLQTMPWVPFAVPAYMLAKLANGTKSGLLSWAAATSLNLAPSSMILYFKTLTRQLESDYVGLLLMTDAGFEPAAAATALSAIDQAQKQETVSQGGVITSGPYDWVGLPPVLTTYQTQHYMQKKYGRDAQY